MNKRKVDHFPFVHGIYLAKTMHPLFFQISSFFLV